MTGELPLDGGRTTPGVVRSGDTVRRPCKPNSAFVHSVLGHLAHAAPGLAPAYLGQDELGREILTFLPGTVPADLGFYSDAQCAAAARIIRRLHCALASFPGLAPGQTVCHNDLSPCNFVFSGDLPVSVIDFDASAPGDPLDDLSYALWMWLDIGNDEQDAAFVRRRICLMLEQYGLPASRRGEVLPRMLAQMRRVASSVFPDPAQTAGTRAWALSCAAWAEQNLPG